MSEIDPSSGGGVVVGQVIPAAEAVGLAGRVGRHPRDHDFVGIRRR